MHARQPALARLGSLASLDLLVDLLADPDAGHVRVNVAEALGLLGPAARRALAALEDASRSDDEALADAALLALERMEQAEH